MQTLRSIFASTPAKTSAPTPVPAPVALEPHQLAEVAGGLPRAGDWLVPADGSSDPALQSIAGS